MIIEREELQDMRLDLGDRGNVLDLARRVDASVLLCMQKMGPLYEAHPRFLAQDMVAVGSRDKFAYSNKRWFHYTDKGYWVEDEAGDIKSFAASAWTIVGRPSNAKKTRDLIYFLESSLYVSPLKFDAAVNLLGVGNGVVDLETGELLPPRPDMYLTKFTPVEYHPGAQCPNFYKHLGRLFQGQDADASIDWLQRAVGAALVHGEQFYVHLVGPEGSGKGTLYRALRAALGNPEQEKSNVVIIASENLDGRTQHPTWLMDLKGARLAIIEEIGKVSPALMNTLTGGDAITARRMRQDPVTFDPTHTLLCSSNERLQLKARQGARGLKRRYKPLDTGPTVPAEERSAQWEIAVQEEAEGILAWVIAGHGNWKARGLADLPGMTEAAEADVVEADWRELWWESQFERFLPATRENRVTTNEDIRINAKRWHEAAGYANWTDALAEEAVAFVKTKGAKPWRTSRTRGYYVKLREVTVQDLIRAA